MCNKNKLFLLIMAIGIVSALGAQDLHFADVQQMRQWYNQSLKMDKNNDLYVNFRDIKYQNLLAFKTGSAFVNVPLVRSEDREFDNATSFLNLSGGVSFDKSNSGLYKKTMTLLGLSYVQKLADDDLYASVGFQGNFTTTTLNNFGIFPDQLNHWGLIPGGVSNDPLRDGKTYKYFSLNTGVSMFKKNELVEWYVGGSMRHVNKPFTEETKSVTYKLPVTWGAQAGVTFKTSANTLELYSIINWKSQADEYLAGLRYNFILDSYEDGSGESSTAFGFGCAYRYKDAFLPNISLDYKKTRIGFFYDMNTSGIRSNGFTRNGYELSLNQKF